jgi:hypothetical protein
MGTRDYPFVGRWLGPKGSATVVLIAPEWIITSEHVASNKIKDPGNVDVAVRFFQPNGEVSAKVAAAYGRCEARCPGMGIAVGRLDRSIAGVPSVAVAQSGASPGEAIEITILATDTIPGAYCRLNNKGHLVRIHNYGNRQRGIRGDSGGAWIVEPPGDGLPVLVGIIKGTDGHDRGVASQPAAFREWIDSKLAEFGASCKWVPRP